MPRSFTLADADFSYALGTDFGAASGQSRFSERIGVTDRITAVTITSRSTDPNAVRFDPGDVYDLSMTFDGAPYSVPMTVTRSDVNGIGVNVVVFRGTAPDGQPFEIIVTPGTDVDAWYEGTRASGSDALFFRDDQNAASTVSAPCFAADTLIDTATGPRPAASFGPGDMVLSRDSWQVPVRAVGLFRVPGTGANAAVTVPPGVLGAEAPVRLSPWHRLLVASPLAALWFAAPEVLVPALALVDAGLARRDPRPVEDYVHLLCDRHEILSAAGLLAESLFLGPTARMLSTGTALLDTGIRHQRTARPVLRRAEGAALVARMHAARRPVTAETAPSTGPARRRRSS